MGLGSNEELDDGDGDDDKGGGLMDTLTFSSSNEGNLRCCTAGRPLKSTGPGMVAGWQSSH